MARTIQVHCVAAALPAFLQNSGKFAAFICTAKGKIVTQNSFLQNILSLQINKTLSIKDVFGIYNARLFNQSFSYLPNKKQAALDTEINNRTLSWELSYFDDTMELILCISSVQQLNDSTAGISIEESHFSAFMNNSPALMWATSTQGRLVIVNKKFKEVTGFSDCVLGKTLWEVFPKEFADQYKQNDEKVLHLNDLVEMEETSLDKFGRKREFVVYKFPLQTADYGLVVAGWSVDITDHKIAHKKLVHQHNRFRQIARLQSHSVRRPLANILGLIDLIQYYTVTGDFSEVSTMIDLLKESSNDLDSIIKKIVRKAGIFNPELQVSL